MRERVDLISFETPQSRSTWKSCGRRWLIFTPELRRALAEQLAESGIRVGKNIEAVIIDLLEADVGRWL